MHDFTVCYVAFSLRSNMVAREVYRASNKLCVAHIDLQVLGDLDMKVPLRSPQLEVQPHKHFSLIKLNLLKSEDGLHCRWAVCYSWKML